MSEILFYHLTGQRLEQVIPGLLERCLERGWRAVVQAGSRERLEALDAHLWTWRDDSFLPHAMTRDGAEAMQPVWLTLEDDNPNGAEVRFLVDGAEAGNLSGYRRGVFVFDGLDPVALEQARAAWKAQKAAGHQVTYWRQNESGGWEKQA
jgi:DNA polymerase-3 subunit chi